MNESRINNKKEIERQEDRNQRGRIKSERMSQEKNRTMFTEKFQI